jgi:uncharacterized membrane protein HdeD (DUF308 family)
VDASAAAGQPPPVDRQLLAEVERRWKWLVAVGVLALLGGCVAIAVPAVASVATAIFIGWIFIFAGSVEVMDAFAVRHRERVALRLLLAVVTVFAGFYLILAPLEGTVTLTFVLVALFLVNGGLRLVAAVRQRGTPGAGLVGFSGLLGILVALLILLDFPSSADWAIGLLVGIDLLFFGVASVSAGLNGRQMAKEAR